MSELLRKHRRAARITANDDDGHVLRVALEFTSTNGMAVDEVREVRTKLARVIARELSTLPYSDFGPENVRVTLLRSLK